MKLTDEIPVLNGGYVKMVDHYGYDRMISEIAGISYNNEKGPGVAKLIKMGHLSPFEFAGIVFKLKIPIAVARQIMRQRQFSYMEKSMRYCKASGDAFIPSENEQVEEVYKQAYESQKGFYDELIGLGVKKEKARFVIGTGAYTTLYIKADLRNLMHFLDLRLDKSAQPETREVAKAMAIIFSEQFPDTADAYFGKKG